VKDKNGGREGEEGRERKKRPMTLSQEKVDLCRKGLSSFDFF
jgi:hypothetical protein